MVKTLSDLNYHLCERSEGWAEYDARGIYLNFVCDVCVDTKMAQYRQEVLNNPAYLADENIEEEA